LKSVFSITGLLPTAAHGHVQPLTVAPRSRLSTIGKIPVFLICPGMQRSYNGHRGCGFADDARSGFAMGLARTLGGENHLMLIANFSRPLLLDQIQRRIDLRQEAFDLIPLVRSEIRFLQPF
jgi:hypothetical protein